MPDLLFPRPPLVVTPEPGRSQPRLFVTRFCIWKEPGVLVRDIALRQGLNIVWSPDSRDANSPIGHGAGKTTFCRLLRYCLGEKTFGTKDQQDRIHRAFPSGQVGIELRIDGTAFAVLRSLSGRSKDIVLSGLTLEEAQGSGTATGLGILLEGLEALLVPGLAELMPSKVGAGEVWLAVLAWLSRDQECRFGDALNWRDKTTNSLSPVRDLSKEQRLQVVRAVLGSFTAEELSAQKIADTALEQSAAQSQELAALDRQVGRIQKSLTQALDLEGLLGIAEWDRDLLEEKINQKFPSLSPLQETALRNARRDANRTLIAAEAQSQTLHSRQETFLLRRQSCDEILPTLQAQLGQSNRGIALAENEGCPICHVSLSRVLDAGCPCTAETGYLEEVRERRRQIREDISQRTNERQSLVEELRLGTPKLVNAELQLAEAKRVAAERDEAEELATKSGRNNSRIRAKLDEYDELLVERRSLADKHELVIMERQRELTQIALRRASGSENLIALSDIFDSVMRELIPGQVSGKISIQSDDLYLSVLQGGERSTAAIQSLKVVAFDLAVLILALEGTVALPGILIHDSPREADLGRSLYNRLYDFVRKLEDRAPFQYIVTTTTKPPDSVCCAPWLCVTLRGGPEEERLMGCNL